jgi:hypothetical protein
MRRSANRSVASTTTAVLVSWLQMKVTTQSAQVGVCWWAQSSQSMISDLTPGWYGGGVTASPQRRRVRGLLDDEHQERDVVVP